ncbi:hypothetical protein SS50377_22397 [Spironucleus salmonicida]|uniref:Uncharacterized protein n=1 Tax=Spironucleus salmonicida TaxID=348837 RepID=V6LN13_9EUKA|nr:hypothetical protein SS50377_22397 [Spironucleus salmonicida]|eukprot:EST42109.1 hypothetical protein SS50377_18418 [Spironucleus salmonicida]
MYPLTPGSTMFPTQEAIAYLNHHDQQRIHFRIPDFRFPAPLQDAKLSVTPPNGFQFVAGAYAFSTNNKGNISVFDMEKQQIIKTQVTSMYEIQQVVKSDHYYIFATSESMSFILTFDPITATFEIINTNKYIWSEFSFSQTGKCYIFSGMLQSQLTSDLFILENKQLTRIYINSVGCPSPRTSALLINLTPRILFLADGININQQIINDAWVFDSISKMWLQIDRNPLKLPSVSNGFCQWRYKNLDVISTQQADYLLCQFNISQKFDEMSWIRGDRAVIMKKWAAKQKSNIK